METWPKFRPDLNVSVHKEPGEPTSVIIEDPVSRKFYRLSREELRLLQALDGKTPIESAIEKLESRGIYYGYNEAIDTVGKASQMGLLLGTKFGSAQFQKGLKERQKQAKSAQRFASVYFLFIPLINPDRFLDRTLFIFKALWNRWTASIIFLLAPGALYLFITGLSRVYSQFLYFFNIENLLYLWIAIVLTKLIHEFAHAYTAKMYGLHVPRMGVAFLIFFPCLYCDTTDAWNLAGRRQRMAIAGAGIMAEAALAIFSTYVWYFSKPGLLNSLAFYQMSASFVSTILFNGNPLLKFDGYFILIDLLDTPNLQQKSFGYIKYLFVNKTLGISLAPNTASTNREVALFTIYGISAIIYRILLYTGIVATVYYRFDKFIGLVLAVLALYLFIVRPLSKGINFMARHAREIRPRPLGLLVFTSIMIALGALFMVPWSSNSVYPCYLDSTKTQKLTAPIQSLVDEIFIQEGDAVEKGQLLFQLDASRLKVSRKNKELEKRILELEIDRLMLNQSTIAQASEKIIELNQIKHELKILERELQLAQSGVIAPFEGYVTKLDPNMRPGYAPGEGEVVGELESKRDCMVKALIPEGDAAKIHRGQALEIWFPGNGAEPYRAEVEIIKEYSEKDLAEGPFSSRFGGEVATESKNPESKDAPLDPQYIFITSFNNKYSLPLRSAGRVGVVFPPKSLARRLISSIAQTFNRESVW
jgi:putative peptide zinc metalloprotease protein